MVCLSWALVAVTRKSIMAPITKRCGKVDKHPKVIEFRAIAIKSSSRIASATIVCARHVCLNYRYLYILTLAAV